MISIYRAVLIYAVAGIVALGSGAAAAQAAEKWEFELVPLSLWSVRLSGSFTVGIEGEGHQFYLRDLADGNLRPAYSIHFEAWKGKWGVLAEATRLDLAEHVKTASGSDVSLDFQNVSIEAELGYRIWKRMAVALGVRHISVDAAIAPPPNGTVHGEQSWDNIIVGVLWRPRLSRRWSFAGRIDVGGFDYPDDIVWNVTAYVDYRLGRHTAIFFGFRFLDYDFINESHRFAYDVTKAGPVGAIRVFW